ncbi:MAG: hypothetical protein GYA24_18995 [Candidatus Lokiarchaeota archaeon]|nr:hypothetical protein [Candidatus Lokiarchaeota archaeon]
MPLEWAASMFNRLAVAAWLMQGQTLSHDKTRDAPGRLLAIQPAITMATGSIFGALLVVFFSVLYSHQIFFSDRWDQFTTKYIELWFFTLAISVLVPALLRFIKHGLVAWYGRACAIAAGAIMIIWLTSAWPTFTTETGYTAIGYMFRENILLFQLALHLSATVVASAFLQQTAVRRDAKDMAFKHVSGMVLGSLVLGGAMCTCIAMFQYPGLHATFTIAIAAAIVLVVTSAIPHVKRDARVACDDHTNPVPERDVPYVRGSLARALVFTIATIAALVLSPALVNEKAWETIATVIPLLYPLIELACGLFYYIGSRVAKQPDAIRGYGDVTRFVIAMVFAMLGLVVALLVSGYYRALVDAMPWLAGATACGFATASATRAWKSPSTSSRSLVNHVLLLAGLLLIAAVAIPSGLAWLDQASYLESIPEDTRDPSLVIFPGLPGVILAGLGIGLLVGCAVNGIADYHQKAPLGPSGEPTWNANATLWFLMIIPAAFYMGQLFFDNRIFEWYAHIQTNVEDTGTTALLVGAIHAILALAFVPILIKLVVNAHREKGKIPAATTPRLPRQQRWAGMAIMCIMLAASVGGAALSSTWPHVEPSNHAVLVQHPDFTLWSAYPSEKVAGTYKPGTFSATATAIEVTMAAGETERAHLVLTPRVSLSALRVNISSLHDSGSGNYFPSTGINWYYVTYNFDGQEEHLVPGNPYQYRGRENVSAVYLAQISNWAATPDANQPLWLSFTSLYNTTAGTYAGIVNLTWTSESGPDSVVIPVRVTVLGYRKPIAFRFSTAIGSSLGAAAPRGRSLWRHGRMGYNPGYAAMLLPKFWDVDWTTGTFTLNYTGFYAALNACAQAGYTFQIYNRFSEDVLAPSHVLPAVPFSAQWNTTVLNILGNASLNMSSTYFDLPHGQGKIRAIDMFVDELYDEPGKDDAWRFRFGQILDRAASITGVKWRLMCTCGISLEAARWPGWSGPGGVYDVVDIRVQMPLGFQFYRDDPAVRHLADDLYPAEDWIYWINSPWPPAPNSAQAYNPGAAVFSQAIQYYTISNVSGFLFWTSGDTTWADGGDGYAGWGSGKYFYPAERGSTDWDPGYRFEMLDDGLEIGELLRHLDAMIANGTAGPLDAASLQQATALRDRFEAMFPDFYTYPRPDQLGELYTLRLDTLQFLVDNA